MLDNTCGSTAGLTLGKGKREKLGEVVFLLIVLVVKVVIYGVHKKTWAEQRVWAVILVQG